MDTVIMLTGGFGFTFDIETGSIRPWYLSRKLGEEPEKRWVDNDKPLKEERKDDDSE